MWLRTRSLVKSSRRSTQLCGRGIFSGRIGYFKAWRTIGSSDGKTPTQHPKPGLPDMKLYLTFDVEIWCGDWNDLDGRFASSFDRYVYGRSSKGEYALPKTLEILNRHGLKGVFFVEPLFAARFGVEYLATIVKLIRDSSHDVQLHLHPEWTDEIRPLVFAGATSKRQNLSFYTRQEQTTLISLGRSLLAEAGGGNARAFRAGSFASNHDTYRALDELGIGIDSSLHAVLSASGPDLRGQLDFRHPLDFENVRILPMSVFQDGIGRLRPAQVGACAFAEMRDAITSAHQNGNEHFVILSHNFELLKQKSLEPDMLVVARFEQLCAFLERQQQDIEVCTFADGDVTIRPGPVAPLGHARLPSTLRRLGEQAVRRVWG
jgi:peptidoglycan/xylan/chitin deacetylase (PgdA/CDA1 family)